VVLDIHSGGKTLDFLPFAAAHILPDKAQEARCFAGVEAFAAPYSMRMLEIDNVGMFDTAVEEQGKVFVTTELGGGGTATSRTVAIARRGVRNLLIHSGILKGAPEPHPTVYLDMPSGDCFTFAESDGLIEPCADLGDKVADGQLLARIHPIERSGSAPAECRARIGGILTGRHFPGLIKGGDCLAVIGVPAG
jgi:N-alpha-acetyl-L-2,4-diaminobutyrate deacetylase